MNDIYLQIYMISKTIIIIRSARLSLVTCRHARHMQVLLWPDVDATNKQHEGEIHRALGGLPILFGQVVYSFECVCNVLPIENSLRRPMDMYAVVGVSNVL